MTYVQVQRMRKEARGPIDLSDPNVGINHGYNQSGRQVGAPPPPQPKKTLSYVDKGARPYRVGDPYKGGTIQSFTTTPGGKPAVSLTYKNNGTAVIPFDQKAIYRPNSPIVR